MHGSALLLLGQLALAQQVSAVPAGARTLTVLLCERPDGCPAETAALDLHGRTHGLPFLDFDAVAASGPAGGERRAAWSEAMQQLHGEPSFGELQAMREQLVDLPLTLDAGTPFRLHLLLADRYLEAGLRRQAQVALEAAATGSANRAHGLPPELRPDTVEAYLAVVDTAQDPAWLQVMAPPEARVLVDGLEVGTGDTALAVPSGWHRVTAEAPGHRTAFVQELVVEGSASVRVRLPEDAAPALEAALVGAVRGVTPPDELATELSSWARAQGLSWVRFALLTEPGALGLPEERVGGYDLQAAWLDVDAGRLSVTGPGPAAMQVAEHRTRLSLGVGAGWLHLGPRDHVSVEVDGQVSLSPTLAVDARLGLLHTAQAYYLYQDWVAEELFSAAVGVRHSWHGPYVGAHATAVVPYALGAQVFGGWSFTPTPRTRFGLEARAGWTDGGALLGAGLRVGSHG